MLVRGWKLWLIAALALFAAWAVFATGGVVLAMLGKLLVVCLGVALVVGILLIYGPFYGINWWEIFDWARKPRHRGR